jgi:hypothetical protein
MHDSNGNEQMYPLLSTFCQIKGIRRNKEDTLMFCFNELMEVESS